MVAVAAEVIIFLLADIVTLEHGQMYRLLTESLSTMSDSRWAVGACQRWIQDHSHKIRFANLAHAVTAQHY